MAKNKQKSEAAKRTWQRIREIAEQRRCSVQEARLFAAAEKRGEPINPVEPSMTEAAAVPKPKKVVDLATEERKLREKYPHVIPGTLKLPAPGEKKRSVEIACQHPGCKSRRRVYTSDLFQVRFCAEHTRTRRKKTKPEKEDK